MTSEAECGGTWYGVNSTCEMHCPRPTGACCRPGGDCIIRENGACHADEGVFAGDGTTCSPSPCSAQLGACCLGVNECVVSEESACVERGGVFLGAGVFCSAGNTCVPHGACCAPNGDCMITTPEGCIGEFQGVDTTCKPSPCGGGGIR